MNPAAPTPDWIAQLAPPHAPPPAAWWPPAPGWWGLALLIVVGAIVCVRWYRRPQRRFRRAALREFESLQSTAHDDAQLARRIEHLMRRYALAAYGRESVAGLSGDAWLAFVVQHGGAALAGDAGQRLVRAAYGGRADIEPGDRARWLDAARAFIAPGLMQTRRMRGLQ